MSSSELDGDTAVETMLEVPEAEALGVRVGVAFWGGPVVVLGGDIVTGCGGRAGGLIVTEGAGAVAGAGDAANG